ncbi:hypothetical protein AQUCO_00200378v1 [Aquilegia coerulea]|uniref:DUF4408 domain-containing protein n=1 Tax=Aquilegia coerulea TaxID=218851 RepID=A0A2G5F352_AQUCA|nr:hypothetical protein AQUCO_00200378v1 [Aquilegia coerulea]
MKKEKQRGTEEKNHKEVETTAMIAMGVVLLVAGVKQGLTTLVEQWRALVFLFLNLLLLTIFFTSTIRSNKSTKTKSNKEEGDEINVKKNKKMKQSCSSSGSTSWPMQVEELFKIEESVVMLTHHHHEKDESVAVVDDNVHDIVVDEPQLVQSKEELNARVESFIMMFRQQLALDAMERSTTRRHSFSSIASK